MPFRKKVLYYGLMLLLTILALEGMARVAYYAAYGQWYGRGGLASDTNYPPPPRQLTRAQTPRPAAPLLNHPFYGQTRNLPGHALNALPPPRRREDTVVIGLLGGSVAEQLRPFLQRALRRHFAANGLAREPVVIGLSFRAAKQPQQVMITANTLLLGGEFDLLVNLDGFNEAALAPYHVLTEIEFPFFPIQWRWKNQSELTAAELLLAGRIAILRREQGRLAAAAAASPLRRSALFGLANRWRQERVAAEIIQRNHELAAVASPYNLERYGPRLGLEKGELLPEAARVWYRGSLALARLAEVSGADYYHFLQPNQYVPDSKPLTPQELESAYDPQTALLPLVAQGYPLLTEFGPDLINRGVAYFDLTGIFADNRETLYKNECCHLNGRGNELLAAAMVRRLTPALRRLGQASPARPVSPLAAARRPAADLLLVDGDFQVYRQEDIKGLRYVRANCAPGDVAARFFLHLTPRDKADLPPHRRGHDFDNLDFSFAEAGGRLWRGQCLAQVRLPHYPIAALRTGQYIPYGQGELWAGGFAFPE